MPPETSIIAIDQGTTGTSGHRLRDDGTFETIAEFEHRQIYPHQGWVEHDPVELGRHVDAIRDRAGDAAALGIANQGETVVAWDAETRRPIYNAIVWQDARTSDVTERLKADGLAGGGACRRRQAGVDLLDRRAGRGCARGPDARP